MLDQLQQITTNIWAEMSVRLFALITRLQGRIMFLGKTLLALSITAALVACGGGGGGGSTAAPAATELEGVWISATDGKYTGSACSLDNSGNYGQRITITFAGNNYSALEENCLILKGNTGSYITSRRKDASFSLGDIYYTVASDTKQNMRAIDFITATTYYTSYKIVAGKLSFGDNLGSFDGTTPAKRAYYVAYNAPLYVKQ